MSEMLHANPRCDQCHFCKCFSTEDYECRRNAPMCDLANADVGVFPEVSADGWCGEFRVSVRVEQPA